MAEEGAEGPLLISGEVGDAFPAVGAGFDEDGKVLPVVFGEFVADFFDGFEFLEGGADFFGGALDLGGDPAGGPHLADEVGGGVGGFDASTVDDDDLITQLGDLAEDVGGDEDGVLLSEAGDEFADGADLVRVEAVSGLVEDEEGRLVDEGVGDADPLAVALGEGFDHLAVGILEAALVEDLVEAAFEAAAAEAFDLAPEGEIFTDPHVQVEGDGFGEIAYFSSGGEGVAEDVMAIDTGKPGGGGEVAGEHAEGGCLSCPVGPQKADDLSGADLEGDIVHGGVSGEALGEVVYFDHVGVKESSRRVPVRLTLPGAASK